MPPDPVVPPSSPLTPTAKISRRGVTRLDEGHVWVYRSDVVSADGVPPGALIRIIDGRGKFLGMALYSSSSQIAIRMISRQAVHDLPALVRERIKAAIDFRERIMPIEGRNTEAYRVIFGEADFLPGLIVDRYNDLLSMQILTQAMDADLVRQAVVAELMERFNLATVVERVDPKIRELEQLPPRISNLVRGEKNTTIFTMNGVKFHYDAFEGQKTGAFLDQRENYAAVTQYARGDALDLFCYQGGFALHLAGRCSTVSGVDSSRPALEAAERNSVLNNRDIEWIEANVFDLLRDYSSSGKRYDLIVLDPPAFAKSKRTIDTALRGYKELNLRALKMLRQGGILVTCSCSYHVSTQDFLEVAAQAARDAGRTLRILEVRGQGRDHPVVLTIPETSYLKCIIFFVSC